MPDFVLSFVLTFFQNQGFCSHKNALIKNEVYIHNDKRQLFCEFFSFRKSIPPTVWVERKRFYFVHQKNISLWKSYCIIRNGSRYSFNSKTAIYGDSEWLKVLSYCQKGTHFWYGSSWICLWLLLTYKSYDMSCNKVQKNIFREILC